MYPLHSVSEQNQWQIYGAIELRYATVKFCRAASVQLNPKFQKEESMPATRVPTLRVPVDCLVFRRAGSLQVPFLVPTVDLQRPRHLV